MFPSPLPLPPSVRRDRPAVSADGFTLIELLTVIAIIGLLSAITLNVMQGVSERQKIARAQSELSYLSLALESYKRQYSDFPQTEDDPANTKGTLCDALTGKMGPTGLVIGTNAATRGKSFLELSKLTLSNIDQIDTPASNEILDPWGNPYRYIYKAQGLTGPLWKNSSYLLYSAGPDGKSNDSLSGASPPGGYINPNDPDNLDNIAAK